MARKRKVIRKTEAPRYVANEIPPSTLLSPTRYDESQSHDYPERDAPVWKRGDTELTEDQIGSYLKSAKHLKQDTALAILRESGHDISSAVKKCALLEEIPDLSILEERVLLAASPVPYTALDGPSESWIDPEKHILDLLPLVQPSVIRDYYYRIGRENFMPSRGWVPKNGLGSRESAGLVTQEDGSPLNKQQERGRPLPSSIVTPVLPRKIGKSDNLPLTMVGFDERTSTDDDLSAQHLSSPFLLLDRTESRLIERNRSLRPIKSSDSPPKKRGRFFKPLFDPSPLILGEPSLRPSFFSLNSSPFSSSSSAASEELTLRKRKDPLEIAMNWIHKENRSMTRRHSKESEGVEEKKNKMRLDVGNDDPIEMMDVNELGRGIVKAQSRSGNHAKRADGEEEARDDRETIVKQETHTINSNYRQ